VPQELFIKQQPGVWQRFKKRIL